MAQSLSGTLHGPTASQPTYTLNNSFSSHFTCMNLSFVTYNVPLNQAITTTV